ncbi:MAG: HAD hydrolase-like protein, partial [Burkholderiaceae bacterium]
MNAPERLALKDIRGAIIDLDGTMLDTALDIQVAINRMRKELHLAPLSIDTVKDFVGKGSENLISRVLAVDYQPAEVEQHFAQALA